MSYKISVIVPVYNVENYLPQCLESILNQTLADIEIICINDGSKDSSKVILENFQKQDRRIYIINKNNEGYGAGCNSGMRLARGEYISIIEADDFIDNSMFENLYAIAKENSADIVKSAYYEYSNKDEIKKINWSNLYEMPTKPFKITDCTQLMYFHPSIWSCIYKREFLAKNNINFVEDKGAGWVDNPFQVQTLCLAQRICYTENAYYYYRLTNPTSSSNIVNISNPFDRSDEIHSFLDTENIDDKNLLAHLYKRELGYIDIVLRGIKDDLFSFACKKIKNMIIRMNNDIIYTSKYITDYEKSVYEQCQNDTGIYELMQNIRNRKNNIPIIVS